MSMSFTGRTFLLSFAIISMLLTSTYLIAGCDYARMRDQESVRTYEAQPPQGPEKSIPVNGGIEIIKSADPSTIRNPFPPTPEILERGRTAYAYFCIQCHGPNLDGKGTVGQSFAPLPTNLKSPYVQQQEDGLLFYRISLGYKRHPPLASTVATGDRWAIIDYIRSVGKERADRRSQ